MAVCAAQVCMVSMVLAVAALWGVWLGLQYGGLRASGSEERVGRDSRVGHENRAPTAETGPGLLLSAVHVGLSGYGGQDEGFQVANVSDATLVLTDILQVGEDSGHVVAFPAAGVILEAGARVWCARNARVFSAVLGFAPDLDYGTDSMPEVPNMSLDAAFRLPDTGG